MLGRCLSYLKINNNLKIQCCNSVFLTYQRIQRYTKKPEVLHLAWEGWWVLMDRWSHGFSSWLLQGTA